MLKLGLQLYTVREEMEKDFEGTLKKVAELGYQGVEFHTFFGRSSAEVKKLLDENGLVAIGTHTPYDRMQNALDEEIAYNKEIGSSSLIVPYLGEEQRKWDEVFDNLKRIGEKCAAQGPHCCTITTILNLRKHAARKRCSTRCTKRCPPTC